MRIFQMINTIPAYSDRIRKRAGLNCSFADYQRLYREDLYYSMHWLLPVKDNSASAASILAQDRRSQFAWAAENGLKGTISLQKIAMAQIEAHNAEVVYNLFPHGFDGKWAAALPGCVKHKVAWWAAPGTIDFSGYDTVVSNFPSLLAKYATSGVNGGVLYPSFDPDWSHFRNNDDRPIDILFFGGYSRHHLERARVLETLAEMGSELKVAVHLDISRFTQLAEMAPNWLGGLSKYQRTRSLKSVSRAPIFGLEVQSAISKAKIVVNGGLDLSGREKGNMRCWEALGSGALLLTDEGRYPDGFSKDLNLYTYNSAHELRSQVTSLLEKYDKFKAKSSGAFELISNLYSYEENWKRFQQLL